MRTLKPSFFLNDVLAEIPPLGRLLFQGLWCIADREGRLEDRPARIKAEVLPYDDANVDSLLNELARRGFITRYAVGIARYIQINAFTKHQNPHLKEAASTIPAPDKHSASTDLGDDEPGGILDLGSGSRSRSRSGTGVRGESDDSAAKHSRRAVALPADFAISPDMREWATKFAPAIAIERETSQFCDYCRANGKVYRDWVAAWRNWISNAVKFESKSRSNGHATGRRTGGKSGVAMGVADTYGDDGYDSWADDDGKPDTFGDS